MKLPENEKAFLDLIPEGERHAIKQHDLALLAGCSRREVKNRVNRLNSRYHIPVGATNAGYFQISSEAELHKVIARKASQVANMRSQISDLEAGWIDKKIRLRPNLRR